MVQRRHAPASRVWSLVLAGWTVIAVVFAVSSSLTYALTYQAPQWSRTLIASLTEWYAWAALTPAVAWVATRFRFERGRWVRRLVIVAAIGIPVAIAKVMLTRGLRSAAGVADYVVITNLATHYLIYWATIGAVHALHIYQADRPHRYPLESGPDSPCGPLMTLRALIVDDEPVARRRIRRRLLQAGDVEIAGQCGDGASAVEAIHTLAPDVVLLDVQMPELDGFGVVQAVSAEALPAIIFVTAFDQYAIRAFDVHALDYLLKPVDGERLMRALARARTWIAEHTRATDPRVVALLESLARDRRFLTRLPARADGRLIIVDLTDVDWMGAADNYVALHVRGRELMVRGTMGQLERELDPDTFVRIHRSAIVQIDRIKELSPLSHGDLAVVMKDGTQLTLSRGYRARLEQILGRAL